MVIRTNIARRAERRVKSPVRVAGAAAGGWTRAFTDVVWTPAYAGLLVYVVIITTYAIGLGSVVITVALISLVLERQLNISGMVQWIVAFFCWAVLSMLGSPWPDAVRGELVELAKVVAIVLVATSTLNSRPRIRLFMIVSLAAFAMYPARGAIFNYFLGGYSLLGRAIWNNIFANPNDMAAFTLLQLSVAAALFVSEPRGLYRLGAAAALVVTPLVILLTQSRGGFLGAAVFAVLALLTYRRKARLLGLGAVVVAAAMMVLPSTAWERLGMVKTIGQGGTEALASLEDDGSAQQRYEIWQTSFRIMRDRPISGIGWGVYGLGNAEYAPRLGTRDTHSTYFNIAAEVGLPGAAIFVCLLIATLRRSYRAQRLIAASDPDAAMQLRFVTLGLLGFLVAAIFATYSGITLFYLHVALVWSLADVQLRSARPVARKPAPRRGALPVRGV